MRLSKTFTTVTPLSKSIALGIFILFPFLGFVAGRQYQSLVTIPKTQYITKNVYKTEYLAPDPAYLDNERCGDLPALPKSSINSEIQKVSGPFWSPDCRNIVWSTNYVYIGYEGPIENVPKEVELNKPISVNPNAGIYLYNDRNKEIKKIYTPEKIDYYYSFLNWSSANKIIFSVNGNTYDYTLSTEIIHEIR